jgi:hypothetical protein
MDAPSIAELKDKRSAVFPTLPLWMVRVFNYEYWPFQLLFFPCFFYWIVLSLRARSFVYFTAANPAIDLGGFFGESKINILNRVGVKYKPRTFLIDTNWTTSQISNKMETEDISFPIICKPDKGEMGFRVQKIQNEEELAEYLAISPNEILVQEFVEYSIELGILYYRYPSGKSGISSVVEKEFMSVEGDGQSSVEVLMKKSDRYRFQIPRFRKEKGSLLKSIPPSGKKEELESIGNHCKGTRFINGERLINKQLVSVFDEITATMDGFYFGRFDLKVKSISDLYKGENIKILEVNGTTSEPAHIYGAGMTLWKAYKDIFFNMKIVNEIAIENHKTGIEYMSIGEVIKIASQHFRMKKEYGS